MKNRTSIRKRKGWQAICFSKPMIVLLAVLVFFLGRGLITMFMRAQNASDRLEEERLEFERAKERHDVLNGDIELLRTDFGKEVLVREKYGVVLPGEEVIKLVGEENEREVIVEEEQSFIKTLFDALKFW